MLDQWNNFFVMVGGGAAALAGLIFVAMSIKPEVVIQNSTHKNRAINMLTGFSAVFMACSLALLGRNPFPGAPPKYIRALLFEYHFTDIAARRATGHWWRREYKGIYLPAISLPENHHGIGPARESSASLPPPFSFELASGSDL